MNDELVIKDFKINWQLLMFTRRREIRVKSVTYECQDGSVVIFKKKKPKKLHLHSERYDKKRKSVSGFNVRLIGCCSKFQCLLY